MKSTIFLSYPSELAETAASLELSLTADGYAVFRDRSALPPGESFDARIRAAVEDSDLFVFLISPASVSPGRYTLTELKFAEQRWRQPAGRVLPVLVEATPKESIPAYLRAVTILEPKGNLVAEVAAEVARLTAPWWRRMLEPRRLVPAGVAAILLAATAWLTVPSYLERRQQDAQTTVLLERARSRAEAGDYVDAWTLLEQANAVAPASHAAVEALEDLAMQRLRGAGLRAASVSRYADLVNSTLPVLTRGTSGATGERLANLLAHIGWADYLRGGVAGASGMDPVERYRTALEAAPANVYAHAMWGFERLREPGSKALSDARQHFAAALDTGRERAYVRALQLSALLRTYTNAWVDDLDREQEALRVVNAMRVGNEVTPTAWGPGTLRSQVWSIYHFGVVTADDQEALLGALPPADHLATIRWLFPETDLGTDQGGPSRFDYYFVRAQVEEYGGEGAAALASYRRVREEFAARKLNSSRAIAVDKRAAVAIRRLGG
jgi:hypothetical protein